MGYTDQSRTLKQASKLVRWSSDLDMKSETSPSEVSGRSAFSSVMSGIYLSDFWLVYKNVFLFDIACRFAVEFPDML